MPFKVPLVLNHTDKVVGIVEFTDDQYVEWLVDSVINKKMDVALNFQFGICVNVDKKSIMHASINRVPILDK